MSGNGGEGGTSSAPPLRTVHIPSGPNLSPLSSRTPQPQITQAWQPTLSQPLITHKSSRALKDNFYVMLTASCAPALAASPALRGSAPQGLLCTPGGCSALILLPVTARGSGSSAHPSLPCPGKAACAATTSSPASSRVSQHSAHQHHKAAPAITRLIESQFWLEETLESIESNHNPTLALTHDPENLVSAHGAACPACSPTAPGEV